MREVTFRLPEEVLLVEAEGYKIPLDIGRLAVAGYADMDFFLPEALRRKKEEVNVYPFPLLTLDCPEGISDIPNRQFSRLYNGLEINGDDQWVLRSARAVFPRNNGTPYVLIGDAGAYPVVDVKLFEEPVPYDQRAFEQAVLATQEK